MLSALPLVAGCTADNADAAGDDDVATESTSQLGYDFPATRAKVTPVYRCLNGGDHFISRAADCEGKTNEGIIGYAQ